MPPARPAGFSWNRPTKTSCGDFRISAPWSSGSCSRASASRFSSKRMPFSRHLAAAVLAALLPSIAGAQRAPADSSTIVRAVEVRRLNIFAAGEARGFFPRWTNRLHRTTRASVVSRELLFKAGDRYDSALVQETSRNLRGLGIFRHVLVDSVRSDSGLMVRLTTEDGWSTHVIANLSS